jgi:zinc/manganese transport system substrate-binding protein
MCNGYMVGTAIIPRMENRMNRRLFLHTLACVALPLIGSGAARAVGKVNAVASFSILADMAREVGGDRIEVTSLVGPNGDAHVYDPTPGDVRTLADAAVFFVNGLGLEGWMSRLEKSSGFKGKVVTASKGVKPRQLETEAGGKGRKIADPHAWQSLANGKIYAQNIRDGLIAADPGGEASYRANAGKFMTEIDEVEARVVSAISALPPDHRRIITTHDAFGYFGATYGLAFIAPQGVSTESEASVQDVAKIIRQIKAQKIPAVFLENISDRRLLDQIAKETGAKVGGALYSDALSEPSGPAGTYLDMFRYNIRMLVAALS